MVEVCDLGVRTETNHLGKWGKITESQNVRDWTGEKKVCIKPGFCLSLFETIMECRFYKKTVKEEYLIFVDKHSAEQQD